ncbi:flagellar basal-body MS-ring/collar protein FliF [Shewanella surugensis]|uniref:Flagellar M-ring protein n=1 Tax=Shewanella surugensis TaxID=212020 RepID=A0ABT0L9L5_9GAMM|nr:flagellar basal-body MS-ring/collar protein FliF [Shewanella surugensis]MCL1124363.1 flagellar M-ring protein FliF [Shewanella surugensis]
MVVGNDPALAKSNQSGEPKEERIGLLGSLGGGDVLKQVTMILALVICLALAVAIMIWAQESEFRPLAKMTTEEMIAVLDELDKNNIQYKIQGDLVKVPEGQYQDVKMLLSRAGIDHSSKNEDFLNKDSGFGVSQRMERARLKYSQELNLARAIEALKNVEQAKVILALPKENVFARNRAKPSATVVVNTRRRQLGQEEIDAIVDIVASAVHDLEPTKVTVTDANGRLLNSGSQDAASARARREQELVQQKESEYRHKIESILMPILGPENFTAQVDVSMDFTAVEKTAKRYNPQQPSLRSEMTVENNTVAGRNGGIPGALSNQPPMDAQIPEEASQYSATLNNRGATHKEATRNFELDSTISHTRQQVGTLSRVSVSVAIDFKTDQPLEDGSINRVSRSEAEIANIRRLLEGAIGFSAQRGDVIEVVSVPFLEQLMPAPKDVQIWEQAWFWRAVKLLLGALVVLVLILAVVRPMLKRLIDPEAPLLLEDKPQGDELAEIEDQYAADTLGMLERPEAEYSYADDGSILIPNLHKDDDMIKAIRAIVANEPELSTQVVKNWLLNDE